MKIGVIQHRTRDNAADDVAALVAATAHAADSGAEFVVLPEVLRLFGEQNPDRWALMKGLDSIEGARFMPFVGPEMAAFSSVLTPPQEMESVGTIALLVGDAVVDPEVHRVVFEQLPNMAVLSPRSESDLQAEAVLELAIGLSLSLAGLVVVAECSGADAGEPGHGGSAIVLLGDVIAEAMGDDDVLIAEVPLPIPQPEPVEALPAVPRILEQRLAHHRGEKAPVDYPADLSS